jgi:ABC-type bacteriocin/lantibiotic exporter with double-glycine peptidase domain
MVSVLREIGYVASFGNISPTNLSQSHCPMIGFWEDGSSFILTEIKPDGTVKYASTENKLKIKKMSKDQFSAKFSGHLILARRDVTQKLSLASAGFILPLRRANGCTYKLY